VEKDGDLTYTIGVPITDVLFAIEIEPAHGAVVHNATTGAFTYTPGDGYTGDDRFTFTVSGTTEDVALTSARLPVLGAQSDTGTITVAVEEPPAATPEPEPTAPPVNGFRYEDMVGHWGETSAVTLANADIMKGIKISNKYYFYPGTELTRGDFIMYLVSTLGLDVSAEAETPTPFADEDDIPSWMKLQARAAYDAEIIKGVLEDGKVYLKPDDKLTRIEVISILNNTVKPNTDAAEAIAFADKHTIPAWAEDAVRNMVQYGILKGYDDNTLRPNVKINRVMSSEFLKQILDYETAEPEMLRKLQEELDGNLYF
jgi:hypothetical protein